MKTSLRGKAKSTLKWEIPDIEKALIVMLEVYSLVSLSFIVQEKKSQFQDLENLKCFPLLLDYVS